MGAYESPPHRTDGACNRRCIRNIRLLPVLLGLVVVLDKVGDRLASVSVFVGTRRQRE